MTAATCRYTFRKTSFGSSDAPTAWLTSTSVARSRARRSAMKARADVEVAQEEERDGRQQEPGLDENDLDRDDRARPQRSCARPVRPIHPMVDFVRRSVPRMSCSAMNLAEVEHDERGRCDRAGDDDLADGPSDPIGHRHDHELERHRCDPGADRLRGGVAEDADGRLPRDEVVDKAGGPGDERERARREEHDAGEDRHLRGGELDVRGDADRPERQKNAESPD